MDSYVGARVQVKLKQPSNTVVYGVVLEVVPGSHLTLRNVHFPATDAHWEQWTVQVSAIEDLAILDPAAPPPPHPQPHQHHHQQQHHPHPHPHPHHPPPPAAAPALPFDPSIIQTAHNQPSSSSPRQVEPLPPHIQKYLAELPAARHPAELVAPISRNTSVPTVPQPPAPPTPQRQASAFVDPAIVSYGNISPQKSPSRPSDVRTPVKSMLAKAAANLPSPGSPFIGELGKATMAQKLAASAQQNAMKQSQASQPRPPVSISTKPNVAPEIRPGDGVQDGVQENGAKKKVRRGQKLKQVQVPALASTPARAEAADPPPVMNSDVSRNGNDMNGTVRRGKGWRNTPLLQPSPSAAGPVDGASSKKPRQKHKADQQQEFAQGDTTDIQDMGDFDFEAGLKQFNKKEVFDEIRAGDTTADEDRLVSHNRIHRPGTYGGKNLHPTEAVLSPKLEPKYNSNEPDCSSDADTELNLENGRSSSKHSVSRAVFPKAKPTRQNSGQVESRSQVHVHPTTASISSDRSRARNRSAVSLVSRNKQAASLATSSPRPDGRNSPLSGISTSRAAPHALAKMQEPHFVLRPNVAHCPTLLPRALESLEAAAITTFGLSQEAIAESAARCIAESSLQLCDGNFRRPSRTNTLRASMTASMQLASPDMSSTVVVLAGNHDIGARALAAARHLLGRSVSIIVAESLFESIDTQDRQVKVQTNILRKMAKGGADIKRGLWSRAFKHIKNLSGPPAVIIDALLAGATYESLLSTNAEYSSNLRKETREMIEWANRSRAPVLSVGCPSGVSGIDGVSTIVEGEPLSIRPDQVLALGAPFQGLLNAVEGGEKWQVSVADIGINIALQAGDAVSFTGSQWVAELQYVDQGPR